MRSFLCSLSGSTGSIVSSRIPPHRGNLERAASPAPSPPTRAPAETRPATLHGKRSRIPPSELALDGRGPGRRVLQRVHHVPIRLRHLLGRLGPARQRHTPGSRHGPHARTDHRPHAGCGWACARGGGEAAVTRFVQISDGVLPDRGEGWPPAVAPRAELGSGWQGRRTPLGAYAHAEWGYFWGISRSKISRVLYSRVVTGAVQ